MGSPGIEQVRWLAPLRPGTRVRVRSTVLEARASKSRPEMGLVKFFFEMLDETDKPLTALDTTLMMGRRPPGGLA